MNKAVITKILKKNNLQQSKDYRGRICWESTEGFYYTRTNNSNTLDISYRRRSGSYFANQNFENRKIETLNKIVEILTAQGYIVDQTNDEVRVSKAN